MRFPADQDIYQATIEWLKGKGHDVVRAGEMEMARATDEELLKKSIETERKGYSLQGTRISGRWFSSSTKIHMV